MPTYRDLARSKLNTLMEMRKNLPEEHPVYRSSQLVSHLSYRGPHQDVRWLGGTTPAVIRRAEELEIVEGMKLPVAMGIALDAIRNELQRARGELRDDLADRFQDLVTDLKSAMLPAAERAHLVGFLFPSGWRDTRHATEGRVPLHELSTAQLKWALWAINTALDQSEAQQRTAITIIDEPEAALHRSAEAHMASSLSAITHRTGRAILVASHSPEILNSPTATVFEVRREEHGSCLLPLGPRERDGLEALGLLPSDLLRRQRAFLLVEGEHDVIVLHELLGEELARLRIHVLPLRGAVNLSPSSSRLLFEFTDAHLLVMLDNLNTQLVATAWADATERAVLDGTEAGKAALATAFSRRDVESKVLREFLEYAIDHHELGRISPFGLSRADIIEYLPVKSLVPKAKPAWSWEGLRRDHAAAREQSPKFENFKAWLSKAHDAVFSDDAIRQAATDLDTIPEDFIRLLKTLEATVEDRR